MKLGIYSQKSAGSEINNYYAIGLLAFGLFMIGVHLSTAFHDLALMTDAMSKGILLLSVWYLWTLKHLERVPFNKILSAALLVATFGAYQMQWVISEWVVMLFAQLTFISFMYDSISCNQSCKGNKHAKRQ